METMNDHPVINVAGPIPKLSKLVLYHAGCIDGAGAALAAWMKFRENAEYRAVNYGVTIPDTELLDREVYVLDFSFKKDECLRMASICKTLTIIDHHKSAMADLRGIFNMPASENVEIFDAGARNLYVNLDMNHSGAVLAWRYFFYPDIDTPQLLLYIEDRDLWRWKLPHSKQINAALASYMGDPVVNTSFLRLETISREWGSQLEQQLVTEGEAILRSQNELVARMASSAEGFDWTSHGNVHRTHAANASCLQSELGDHLLHPPPEASPERPCEVAAIYYWSGPADAYRVSLRSRPDGPDVAEIAKRYGGGGHRNAAGFERHQLPWRDRAEKIAENMGAYDEDAK